jgi:hypothetical protein
VNRRRFAAQTVDRVEVLLDEPGGPGQLPGGRRMPDRVIGQPALRVPDSSVAVQFRHPAGLVLPQAGAEQVGEQVMVAPPAAHLAALPLEHLLGQEVKDVAVAAGERRHEPGGIGLPAQR